jgi:hypothetical protein
VTAFIDALLEAVAAYERKPEEESARSAFLGGLKAGEVLRVYQAFRTMTDELNARRPKDGLYCLVTRETLMGMAVSHRSEAGVAAIGLLEPAPAYYVKLHDLLALHAYMSVSTGQPRDIVDTVTPVSASRQPVSYSNRQGMGPPPEPPPAIEVPPVPLAPVAQQSAYPAHPVAAAAATGAPRPMAAQPPRPMAAQPQRPTVPPVVPAIPPPALVEREGFVDVTASGLEGLTDDQIVAAVTSEGAVDPSLVVGMAEAMALDPTFMGSSGSQPQSPGEMAVRHPLMAQQTDPRTGSPIGVGVGIGPTPQQLQRMRRKMEGGDT